MKSKTSIILLKRISARLFASASPICLPVIHRILPWPRRIVVSLMVLAGILSTYGQPNFVRVTSTVLTAESLSGGGAAWADYDGDGWLDLAQGNYAGANHLFHNNRDGTFSKITTNGVAIAGPESYAVSWGDFDNDGWFDLFIADGYGSGAP